MRILLRLYDALLRLYPRRFRTRYREALLRNARERSREPRFQGRRGRLRFALFLLGDLLRSVPRERLRGLGSAGSLVGSLASDARFALRSFASRPGFALAAVVTLGLGIGATTAIFSVTDAVLLRPLPYPESRRLVQLGVRYEGFDGLASVSPPEFRDWRERSSSFRGLAASRLERRVLRSGERPVFVNGAGVSTSFFRILGVEAVRGRTLGEADEEGEPVAVVSHGFWQRRMGGDPDPVGRSLVLGDESFTVVGVLSRDFHPPEALHQRGTELWYPLRWIDDPLDERGFAFLQALGRLEPGVSLARARDEMQALGRILSREYPEVGERGIGVLPLRERTVAGVGSTLYLFLGAVGLLLAIACANVAHLFLVRATERRREMAVRTAMGASRGRIVRHLLTESLVLSLLGGGLGVALAFAGIRAFKRLAPGSGEAGGFLPRLAEVGLDPRALAFAGGLALATGVIFALVPALRWGPGGAAPALKEGSGTTTPGRGTGRARSLLLAGETSLSLVLLFGAGLLLHSFVRLARVDPGFDPAATVHADVATDERYESAGERTAFFERLVRSLQRDSRVMAAGATHNLPMDGNQTVASVVVEGAELSADGDAPGLGYHQVSPGYFRAMGIERLRGRGFTWDDDGDAPVVALVNESMARRFWPGGDPLGARVRFAGQDSGAPWLTVVGVVRDVRQYGLDRETGPELFIPLLQSPRSRMQVVVRGDGDPATLVPVLRRAVEELDPVLPIRQVGTVEAHVARSLSGPRFYTALLTTFAAVALVLTFVGVYGTVSYSVEQRTREMGIRIALGAGASGVVGMVVREGMAWTGIGALAGLAGAWAGGRLLEGFVFGLAPTDPGTLAAVGMAVLGVTLLACYLPARRVLRLDPMTTLRTE